MNTATTPRQVEGYTVLDRLGSGGFGEVYRANQPAVGRDVAIKIVKPEFSNREAFVRRFETEARLVASLEHPHIVPLYDFWRDPQGAYLVMRLLDGTVEDRLRSGKRWAGKALMGLLLQVGSALSFAHAHGIVHGDVKPANILLDSQDNAYLGDFGLSAFIRSTSDGMVKGLSGTPAYVSPERIQGREVTPVSDVYSLALVVFEMLSGVPAFKGPSVSSLIDQQLTEPLPDIRSVCPDASAELQQVLSRATSKDPAGRYDTVELFVHGVEHALQSGNGNGAVAITVSVPNGFSGLVIGRDTLNLVAQDLSGNNPYKGLRAFDENDSADFYGRSGLIHDVITRLGETGPYARFVAVVGPSGCGKSSLVKAGVIPALRRGALPNWENAYYGSLMPGSDPFAELGRVLRGLATAEIPNLDEQLRTQGLNDLVKALLQDSASELILVVDQFEECFTLGGPDTARAFMDLLYDAVTAPDSQVRILVTLRADFFDVPLQHRQFGQLMQARAVTVAPMSVAELRSAIVEPAQRVSVAVEEDLVRRILRDLESQPGALPLLQYALRTTFERRQGAAMRLADYEASGGVFGALAQRSEELYGGQEPAIQEAARQLFMRLVNLGEGKQDTRRRVLWSELPFGTGPSDPMRRAVDFFGQHRLITFDRDSISREPTVEVAHEALIVAWTRLRGWLDESRAELHLERRLSQAVTEWRNSGKEESFLADGVRLEQFRGLLDSQNLLLTTDERTYVEAALAKQEAGQRAEQAKQERMRALEKRARTVLTVLVAVFGVGLVVAVFFAALAVQQRKAADEARQETVVSLDHTRALRMGVESGALLSSGSNVELAALLAVESLKVQYTDQAYLSLIKARQADYPTRVLEAHAGGINRVVFSADGKQMVTCSEDKTARIWDVQSGKVLVTLQGHTAGVFNAAFSPDGTLIATAGRDKTVRVWEVATGKQLQKLTTKDNKRPWGITFSPDGSQLFAGVSNGSIWVWSTSTWAVVQTYPGATGALDIHGPGHSDYVLDIQFSHNGKLLATASGDTTVRIWDVSTAKTVTVLAGHTSEVWGASWSPDDSQIVTASWDGTIRIWDVANGRELRRFLGHSDAIRSAQWSPDGQTVLTASDDRRAMMWDVASGTPLHVFAIDSQPLWDATYAPDGKTVVTVGYEGMPRLWNVSGGKSDLFRGALAPINDLAFSPDGKLLVAGGNDRMARLWDVATQAPVAVLKDHVPTTGGIWSIKFSPDGKQLLTAADDRRVMLHDVATGKLLNTFAETDQSKWDVMNQTAFSPDGKYVLTSSLDKTVRVWDASTYKEVGRITQTAGVWGAAFSPDGKLIATGNADGLLAIYDATTFQPVRQFTGHKKAIFRVTFSPDGTLLASTSEDGTVRLWNVATGDEVVRLAGHNGDPTAVFSPDGQYLLTSGYEQSRGMGVWEVSTGKLLRAVYPNGPITAMVFSPDGKQIAFASTENNANLVSLIPSALPDLVSQVCAGLHRDFSDAERQLYELPAGEHACASAS